LEARGDTRPAHPRMWIFIVEALAALGLLIFIVWWTMFSGRRKGERQHHDDDPPGDAPDPPR
ncbi:MAG: hypothetical protein ABIR94_11320, partial [Rubrivivax sp.]